MDELQQSFLAPVEGSWEVAEHLGGVNDENLIRCRSKQQCEIELAPVRNRNHPT